MMSYDAKLFTLIGVALVLIGVSFYSGFQCGPSIIEQPETGIDAGAGEQEIDEKLDAAAQATEKLIEEIEQEHQENIRSFDDKQRREYEQVRSEGPEAVADWLSDFNRKLRGREP